MTAPDRLDFDAFRRERSGKPKVVALGGVEYMLPASLPAATALDIIALNKTAEPCEKHAPNLNATCRQCKNPDATPEQIFELAEPLFGVGVLRKIALEHGLDVDELGDLIIHTFQMYNAETVPNRAARRARGETASRTRPTGQRRTSG